MLLPRGEPVSAMGAAKNALKVSIKKNKRPSYEFYPHDDPSVDTAKKFTQGADGKELEVQAT